MTVGDIPNKIKLSCDGVQTEFDFNFKYIQNSDIKVYLPDIGAAADDSNLLIEGSDYTLQTEDRNVGGTVVFSIPPVDTKELFIIREEPYDQTVPLKPNTNFPEKVIETGLDKLTMICQQLRESVSRCIKVASNTTIGDILLPGPKPGSALIWNDDGTNLKNTDYNVADLVGDIASVRDSEENAANSATAAAESESNARDWATKMDGKVNGEDYSSKYYANEAKEFKSNIKINHPYSLLESKYSEAKLNNASWLRSEGQENSKAVYVTAYEALQVEYNSEIEEGQTVELPSGSSYTKRGLSVKLSSEEYTDYDFVLNTANETFRLKNRVEERVLIDKKEPTLDDPNWYNLYSDGWLEQGGCTARLSSTSKSRVVTLLKEMADINYNVQTLVIADNSGTHDVQALPRILTTKQITFNTYDNNANGISLQFYWQVSGYTSETPISTLTNLYFYVGETVQNANLINAGRIEEKLVDKVNASQAAHASSPSVKYDDLTLGASGNKYIAPSDGYYFVQGTFSTGGYLNIINEANRLASINGSATGNGANLGGYVEASKGQEVRITYANKTSTTFFRFIYKNGASND